LYRWHEPEPYLVLGGTAEHGETHVTCDFQDIIDRLYEADVIYGHNILGFDIAALLVHAGADGDALAPKAVDTLVTARHHTPPAPRVPRPSCTAWMPLPSGWGWPGRRTPCRTWPIPP